MGLKCAIFKISPKLAPKDIYMKQVPCPPFLVELITFEILAAERLRLMGFDNRLIIDCFANLVHLNGNFLQIIDSEVRNVNPLHYIQLHFQK